LLEPEIDEPEEISGALSPSDDIDVVAVDDTYSPLEVTVEGSGEEPSHAPNKPAIDHIRQTLVSTGDIPAGKSDISETFMVPPSKLEPAESAAIDAFNDDLPDLDADDSLDLDDDTDSVDLADSLDDLDDE
jgi:hypothetical protein